MSLIAAKSCFQENCNLVNASKDPLSWNLNSGLLNLVDALSVELKKAHRERDELARRIANLESRLARMR